MVIYLLQSSACLIAFYGLYHILLRLETFFSINRIFLLSSIIMAIAIPLIAPYVTMDKSETILVFQSITTDFVSSQRNNNGSWTDYWPQVLKGIYFIGVVVVMVKLVYGLAKIYKAYRNSFREQRHGFTLLTTEGYHLPYSFFGFIFLSKYVQLDKHLETILKHESVHIRHWHTIDILFIECIHALFWFNPIMILYKKAIRQSHEYIADAIVCQRDAVNNYSALLISQTQSSIEMALTNQFFNSQIKNRLTMMYSKRSEKMAASKYALFIPILVSLIILFSSSKMKTSRPYIGENFQIDTLVPPTMLNDALDVNVVNNYATVTLKNGKTESYNLNVQKEKKQFESLYGPLSAPQTPSSFSHELVLSIPPNVEKKILEKNIIYIIDDVESKDLNDVYPKDIERIDVIKDKSVLAKYGERGSDGVIIITTKNNKPEVGPSVPISPPSHLIYENVDEMPRFPGCEHIGELEERNICAQNKMFEYITNNLKYPEEAKKNSVEGTCIVSFVIDRSGYINDLIIKRDIGYGCGDEVIRLISSMNNNGLLWIPAQKDNKAVVASMILPVKFALK